MATPVPVPAFIVSVDLGQVNDFSAVTVLKVTPAVGVAPKRYDVVALKRWPLGTSYPAVVAGVGEIVRSGKIRPIISAPPDAENEAWLTAKVGNPALLVDGTGVGRGIMSLFLDAKLPATITPIVITGGLGHREDLWDTTTGTMARWVSKVEFVGSLQAGLQSQWLKIAGGLDLAETLRREMEGFRVKVSRHANELYSARESEHDDLLLSLAMACWFADQPVHTCGWGADPTAGHRTPSLEEAIAMHEGARGGRINPFAR
jgi:hypothetical protein